MITLLIRHKQKKTIKVIIEQEFNTLDLYNSNEYEFICARNIDNHIRFITIPIEQNKNLSTYIPNQLLYLGLQLTS